MTETKLALALKEQITAQGPMGVDAFMAACLYDDEHGYYSRGRNFLPEDGTPYPHDFVTAPELTPVFGQVLARWVVKAWEQVGRPNPFTLMEGGPGRGVLMRDMLGELQQNFAEVYGAARPVLVEVSYDLQILQRRVLANFPQCEWRADAAVEGAVILVANELLDAFPHQQFGADGGERMVCLVEGELGFIGDVVDERSPAMEAWLRTLPKGLVAACFLDYGADAKVSGDTLQGVWKHQKVNVLERCGEVDLTCQVNFKHVRAVMVEVRPELVAGDLAGLAEFLMANGILELALADGPQGVDESCMHRLLHPSQMGSVFKVQTLIQCSPTHP